MALLYIQRKAYLICLFILLMCMRAGAQGVSHRDRICGKWENEEKSLRIQVYTEQGDFRAKIIWFSDTEGKPMSYWKDRRNPNPALRNRTILGMSILSELKYNAKKNRWEDGKVYDSKHGKTWNASAFINKKGLLKVRGYWHFKFIGQTITFHRIK